MKQPTQKQLLKMFREHLADETGIHLDFRKHQFLDNQNGASPCFDYDFAKNVITELYAWGEKFIKDNDDEFPYFGGWEYNLDMEIEKLRTTKLQVVIQSVCHDLYMNFTATYRHDGNKVFKYSPEQRAYIFDHIDYS